MSDVEKKTPPAEAVKFELNEDDAKAFRAFKEAGGIAKLTELSEKNDALTVRAAALEADSRKKRFTDLARGRAEGSDGTVWQGDVQEHVTMLTELAESFGDESPQLARYVTMQTEQARKYAEATKHLLKPVGTNQGGDEVPTALERIDKMATELAEKEGISFHEARTKVADQNPKLFSEAREGK